VTFSSLQLHCTLLHTELTGTDASYRSGLKYMDIGEDLKKLVTLTQCVSTPVQAAKVLALVLIPQNNQTDTRTRRCSMSGNPQGTVGCIPLVTWYYGHSLRVAA
jgi:hypothetical protein